MNAGSDPRVPRRGSGRPAGRWRVAVCVAALSVGPVAAARPATNETGKAAAQEDPGDAVLASARIEVDDGFFDLAQQRIERWLARRDRTAGEMRDGLVLLSRALYGQGKYPELLQALRPESAGFARSEWTALFAFWRAAALHGMGRPGDALKELDAFTPEGIGPDDAARVERLRASCLVNAGRTNDAVEAIARIEREYSSSSERPAAMLDGARILLAAGDLPRARAILERLASLPPDGDAACEGRYWLARTRMRLEDWPGAVPLLTGLVATASAPPDVRSRAGYALAAIALRRGDTSAAEAALRRGIQDARNPRVKTDGGVELGSLLLDVRRVDEGVALLKSCVAEMTGDSRAPGLQLRIAEALLEHDRPEAAVLEFQHYLETFTNRPGQARASYGHGWGLIRGSRFAEAATAFSKACTLFDDPVMKTRSLFKVGDAYFANGQFKLAAEPYASVAAQGSDPSLAPRALFQLAECLRRTDRPQEAEKTYRDLLARHPTNAVAPEALLQIAEIHKAQDRWQDAIACYDEVMNAYSNGALFATALHGRAMARYHLFRFGEALSDFQRVTTKLPSNDVTELACYMQGMCLYWTGSDDAATALWRDFTRRYPASAMAPDVLYTVARFEYNRKNFDSAQASFLQIADRFPSHERADNALLWAGRSAAHRKEYVKAIDLFARAAKDYPTSEIMAEVRFAQADALWELGRYAAAVLLLDEIIGKFPDSDVVPLAWGRKGDCQFTLGAEDPSRYAQSIESYRAVANHPSASLDLVLQAEYKIGRSCEKLDRPQKAFEQYYEKVIVRYFADREKGAWHDEASKVWFTRAALNAADLMEAQKDWDRAVRILERIAMAGVPAAEEARARIRRIKSERWWLFY